VVFCEVCGGPFRLRSRWMQVREDEPAGALLVACGMRVRELVAEKIGVG